MFFGRLLVSIVVTVGACAWAAPAPWREKQKPLQTSGGQSGAVACDPISKYNTEWFEQRVHPLYQEGINSTALFYSYGMSELAKKYATSGNIKLITIWDLWSCALYDDRQIPTNPLRCIHANKAEQRTYFENMSRAFAHKAVTFATVMHSDKNFMNPPLDGIWARIEFDALKRRGNIDALGRVSESISKPEIFWARPGLLWRQAINMAGAISAVKLPHASSRLKRSYDDQSCPVGDPYKRFAHIRW